VPATTPVWLKVAGSQAVVRWQVSQEAEVSIGSMGLRTSGHTATSSPLGISGDTFSSYVPCLRACGCVPSLSRFTVYTDYRLRTGAEAYTAYSAATVKFT
jgi:hypothetical protein